jgi:hypothetical protein
MSGFIVVIFERFKVDFSLVKNEQGSASYLVHMKFVGLMTQCVLI